MTPVSGKENLKREIGVFALALAILNITVGTGIFVIPAIIAENLGATAILAYVVCGIIIFLIALCLAELGSKTTATGGVYTYIETAFGPYAGFLANNIYWFGASVLSDAALSNALSDTLVVYFPFPGKEIFRIVFLVFLFAVMAFLNIRSLKSGLRMVEIAAITKMIPLVILVIVGTAFVSTKNLQWVSIPTMGNIGTASLLLFYAFMGVEAPLTNGGEIKNPKRTVPLGVFFGTACVLILYMLLQLVTQGVLGDSISAHQSAPLAAVAAIIFGKAGITIVILATVISMLGTLAGEILSIPRTLFAGARDGLMPKALARVHPRFFTPYIAIIVYASLGLLFAIFGAFKQLAVIASASLLIIYLGAALATIKLRRLATTAGSEKIFVVPGGAIIPLIASCAIIWLLSNLSRQELTHTLIFILVFSLIYAFNKWRKKMRQRLGDSAGSKQNRYFFLS